VILADTSVWIDHLHRQDRALQGVLVAKDLLIHPFVIGEIAVGRWPDRIATLEMLRDLPMPSVAEDQEVLRIIEDWELSGTGIGYLDVHLLASVLLTPETRLWTRDKRLREVAKQLSLDAKLN
jgi:predicted nucleic acid-binding protein